MSVFIASCCISLFLYPAAYILRLQDTINGCIHETILAEFLAQHASVVKIVTQLAQA